MIKSYRQKSKQGKRDRMCVWKGAILCKRHMKDFTDKQTSEPRTKERGSNYENIRRKIFQSEETEYAKDSNEKLTWVC